VTIECDHPRPALNLPGYVPPRLAWQVPSYIPGIPNDAARVIRDAFQGIYNELTKQGRVRNLIPLIEDMYAQPGSVISGVGNGQTITLLPPGAEGYLDPVTLLLTDVEDPVTVVSPDGTTVSIGDAGSYTFDPAGPDNYETNPGTSVLGSMSAYTVLGNPTGSAAPATEIPVSAMTVIGRRSSADNVASITPPTLSSRFLRVNTSDATGGGSGSGTAPTSILWSAIFNNDLPKVQDGQIYMNVNGTFSAPLARNVSAFAGLGLRYIGSPNYNLNVNASTSIVVDFPGTNEVQRAALTGDVTASQNSNTTAFRSFSALSVLARASGTSGVPTELAATPSSEAVLHEALGSIAWGQVTTGGYADGSITDAKFTNRQALSVHGRAANSVGAPADIASVAGSNTVLRESGSTIGWGTVANAGLANMAAGTVKGRAVTAGTGVPTDLTGAQTASLLRFATFVDTTSSGTVLSYAPTGLAADTVGIRISPPANLTIQGMALADGQQIVIRVGRSSAFTVTINSEDLAATATERFNTPNNVNLVLRAGEAAIIRSTESRNNVIAVGRTSVADADYGDITVSANGATWTIDNDVVTDAKLRNSGALSVIGRSANSSGDPADISASAASGAVLRESGSTLGFGTIATAGITDDAVTNAKLANMTAGTTKGRFVTAGTGDPTDLTGDQQAGNLRYLVVLDTASSGTVTSYAPTGFDAGTTYLRISPPSNLTLRGMALAAGQEITMRVGRGTASTLTLNHEDASANSGEQFNCPNNVNLVLRAGESAVIRQSESRGNVIGVGRSSVADADYGDITVSSNGATWTIDNNTVSDAKLRDSAALSVIGRSANSTGDPADIATSADGDVLRRSGTTLGFGAIATAGITNDAVTDAKLRNSGALSVIGRSANSSGDPADISATAASDAVLRESGSVLGFGTIATGGIANDAVTDAKLRNSGACSVIGRSANSSGDPADISAATNDRALVRRSNALVFDQIITADIADGVITVAKLAGIGANSILGNDTAGTLTPNAIAVGTNTVLGRVAGNIVAAQLATGQVAANAITDAKLRQSAARSVIGRTGSTTGDVADISAVSGSDNALRESGGTLTFGTLATGAYANNSVTNAKLAQMAQSTIRGRAAGAGTGDVTDLSAGQVVAIIESTLEARDLDFTGTNSFAGTTTFSGNITVNARMLLFGTQTLSPASSQNDMSVSSSVTVVRMDPSAHIFVTGIVPSADGHFLLLINVSSSFNITLVHESGSSSAANRFVIMDNGSASDGLHLRSRGGSCLLWYDGTSDRWRPVSMWNLITVSGGPT